MSNSALKLLAASGAKGSATYVDDVFSTFLYTGTGANVAIDNGIDLSGEGGLVWIKGRNLSWSHTLYDTVNGTGIGPLNTAETDAPNSGNASRVTAFNSDGFIGSAIYILFSPLRIF